MTANTTARMMPMTANAHAMLTAVPAIPLNPSTAAMSAMTKKVIAHPIMLYLPKNEG